MSLVLFCVKWLAWIVMWAVLIELARGVGFQVFAAWVGGALTYGLAQRGRT